MGLRKRECAISEAQEMQVNSIKDEHSKYWRKAHPDETSCADGSWFHRAFDAPLSSSNEKDFATCDLVSPIGKEAKSNQLRITPVSTARFEKTRPSHFENSIANRHQNQRPHARRFPHPTQWQGRQRHQLSEQVTKHLPPQSGCHRWSLKHSDQDHAINSILWKINRQKRALSQETLPHCYFAAFWKFQTHLSNPS